MANVLAAPFGTTEYDTDQQRRRGRALHARRRRAAGAHRAGRHRAAADLHLPRRPADRRRPRCSTRATSRRRRDVEGRTRPSTRRTRCSTRSRSSSRSSTRRSGSRSSTWRRTSPAGARRMDDLDAADRDVAGVRRRRAAGVLPGHPGPAELMSLSELVRRRPPRGDSRGGGRPPAPVPTRKIGWRVRLQARPVAAAHGARRRSCCSASSPTCRCWATSSRGRTTRRTSGILHSPFVGWANFERVFSQPAVPRRRREHAGHHGVPAGVLLPDPDLPGAAAQQRDHAADAHDHPVDRLPAPLLLVGAGGDGLPADLRRRRADQPDAARPRLGSGLRHDDEPGHVPGPHHHAVGLEGRGLGDHHLPRRAEHGRPSSTRRRPWTGPAGGGGCGTSRCPRCGRSSSCC